MNLRQLGWDERWEQAFAHLDASRFQPCRVIRQDAHSYRLQGADEDFEAEVSGRFRHDAKSRAEFPVVGDWVAVEAEGGRGRIGAVLPRRSSLGRKAAGRASEQQLLAANVDLAFLVCGLDGDFNLRRIERYLTLVWSSGALPIVLLNKADAAQEINEKLEAVRAVAPGTQVLLLSALRQQGIEAVRGCITEGKTAILLGSSGAGKSTLANALLGVAIQETKTVREDDSRGRHTTTHRELFLLPGAGVLIDTPGLRELLPWAAEDGLGQTFSDIEALAASCHFGDCTHLDEPGCAVRAALADGRLASERFEGYAKLSREMAHLALRADAGAHRAEAARWKSIHKEQRRFQKAREKEYRERF